MNNPYQLEHSDFTDEVMVVCPKCADKAIVKGPGLYKEKENELTYCVCTHCGYNQKYQDRKPDVVIGSSSGKPSFHHLKELGGGVDPYFHHPLWYMVDCLEGVIWAYNIQHLEVIEAFIATTDRSRNGLPNKNNSIAARLPKWMSTAKNRKTVLKCIKALKRKSL